ncbi:RNA polymerase sporulation sigma factor SigK [Clostridium sp. 'deep sea']|uniref:RNA polymerase sporulation sigma factor SigK n=1 Tax=Clostridium sp. 'deep sea' TaxID=2779445 RepID=UPI0018967A03|nr:RNA polymerase sporulation sigma factor SigK [Clostridium sp. 'deep sea']QOR35708.1 RNA polymerase sporulation sigma factor SigK [Clostridium sp. 'deep sea']
MIHWLLLLLESIGNPLLLVSYVSSASFPQPLSSEEEKHYLQKFAEGDLEARSVLITHNLRLVAHVVKKYENKHDDTDDLISLGTIGLIKAVETFKFGKGTRLATYAARCIENEILMHLRSTRHNRRDIYLREPIGIDKEGNEITLMDILPDNEQRDISDTVTINIESNRLVKLLPQLSKREQSVLILRYGLFNNRKYTQKEIAKHMNISRSYVSRIEKKAIQRLRTIMQIPFENIEDLQT